MPEILTRKGTLEGRQETRRASIRPPGAESLSGRECDAVIITPTPVLRRLDDLGEVYEVLNPGGVECPPTVALNLDHNVASVRDQVGLAYGFKLTPAGLVARLRFAETPAGDEALARVVAGEWLSVSVGYSWIDAKLDQSTAPPTVRVTRASLDEVSLVNRPADPNARIRSQPRPEGFPMETQPAAPAVPDAAMAAAEQRIQANNDRIAGIIDLAHRGRHGDDFAQRHIREGSSLAAVQVASLELLHQRTEADPINGHISVTGGYDALEPQGQASAMAESIVARRRPDLVKLDRGSRGAHYRGMTDDDILRELTGDRRLTLRTMLLGSSLTRAHTTSDLPLLLENIANKALLPAHELAAQSYRRTAAQRSFADFRPSSFLRPGDFPAPLLNPEAVEITLGTLSESKESVTAYRYARRLALSREVLVNDGLGALADPAAMAGRRCADLENATVYAQLALNSGSGPTLRDGSAMCTTVRTNKASSGTVIDATNIGAGRAAMRGLTSLDGLKLNISPTMVVCGAAKEHQALQVVVAATVPATDATTNPYKGRMDVVADANIAGNNWYLFADPSQVPTLVWGYIDGYDGPRFETQEAWTTDGVEFRVILYFGTGAVDWRGVYHNPGA